MSGQQFFSEKEVGEIVKRAAELQEKSPGDGTGYTPGVSRDELARVAKEMGIDPGYLDKALQERLNSSPADGMNFLGVPLMRQYDKVVQGELPPEDFDVVLEELGPRRRSRFTSQVGRSLQSRIMAGIGYAFLTVSSREGRTRIRMRSIALFAGLLTLYPMLIASVIISSQLADQGVASWVPPAIFGGALVVAWGAFAALARSGHATIKELGDRIEARIASVTSRQTVAEQANLDVSTPEVETNA